MSMSVPTKLRIEVGVRELKTHLSSYLDRVQAGAEIVVTEHGRPIARLTTLDPDTDRLVAMTKAGIVRPASEPRALPSRRMRLDGDGEIEQLVAEQRR